MNNRERFLAAAACLPTDLPPVWLMRQAGRYLPEYRALKEKYSFLELVRTPELAAEVTLQPIRRFDFDAAIIFSDILVIPEAMGMPYDFPDGGGIRMLKTIQNADDINSLNVTGIAEKLSYVGDALKIVKHKLDGKNALIGFCGSPWTLAAYMIEGKNSRDFAAAKNLFYAEPQRYHQLLDKITVAIEQYLEMQIAAGAEILQIFDSWGGILSESTFGAMSAHYLKRIVDYVSGRVPVIIFSKGAHHWMKDLIFTGANVLGFDGSLSLHTLADQIPAGVAIQGNLDPAILMTDPQTVRKETRRVLNEINDRPGFIFNLGHGILPATPLGNVAALMETIRE